MGCCRRPVVTWLLARRVAPVIHPASSGSQRWGQVIECRGNVLCHATALVAAFPASRDGGVVSGDGAVLWDDYVHALWVSCSTGLPAPPVHHREQSTPQFGGKAVVFEVSSL
jgi:hypothetical protein